MSKMFTFKTSEVKLFTLALVATGLLLTTEHETDSQRRIFSKTLRSEAVSAQNIEIEPDGLSIRIAQNIEIEPDGFSVV